MRIAFFTDTYLPEVNGVVTSISEHTRRLVARGHEIVIFAPKYRGQASDDVPGIRVERYPSVSFATNKATRIALPSVAGVLAKMRSARPDVVHIHTPLGLGFVGLLAAKMLRVPNVQTYHTYIPDFMQYLELWKLLRMDELSQRVTDSIVFDRMMRTDLFQALVRLRDEVDDFVDEAEELLETLAPLGFAEEDETPELTARIAWRFTRALYNRADLVITPSGALRRELMRHGVTAPVRYLSNGIDLDLPALKEEYASTGRIIHAGRLGYEKNVDIVIRAFGEVARQDSSVELHIVGGGPAEESLQRLVRDEELEGRVRFLGFMSRSDLASAYRTYDFFATASTIETQGIVLLEAMAAGLPVLGVRALAIPEIVKSGKDGIVVRPSDVRAMAEGMRRLAADEPLRERMGRAARRDVACHALDVVVDDLERVYSEVCGGCAE